MSISGTNDKSINTELSFPPILPPDFEQFLYSYNSINSSSRNEELNLSMKRRKLDFTIDAGSESDPDDRLDINIDNSTGRTFNSPCDESSNSNSRTNFGSDGRSENRSIFIRSEDFGVDMASPASTPIRR